MSTGGKPNHKNLRVLIAEAGNRLAPVVRLGKGLPLGPGNSFAPFHEAGALAAGNHPPIERLQIHALILL